MSCCRVTCGVALAIVALWAGSGAAEVFEIPALQEARVTTDADGVPVSLDRAAAVGDSTEGRYLRAAFTFDLSFLPPGAVVSSAVVHTRVSAAYGDLASLGTLRGGRILETTGQPSVDIQPQWGTSTLVGSPVDVTGAVTRGSEVTVDLTEQFVGYFPTPENSPHPGRAVVRFQFSTESSSNGTEDFCYLDMTLLELDVELPDPIAARPVGRHLLRCIPVVASLPGASGTQWVTELQVTARHDGSVWLYFTETGENGTTSFSVRRVDLGMWQTRSWQDVLPDLFGITGTKGWLEVFSTDPEVVATARVANVGGTGAYGQTVPLVDESQMLRLNEVRFGDTYRRLVNLVVVDDDNRTNVGLVNLGPGEVAVRLIAIAPGGSFLGDYTIDLGPFEHRQIDRLESVIPAADGVGLVALSFGMESDTESRGLRQGVAVYASRVDNTTGDAVFVLP